MGISIYEYLTTTIKEIMGYNICDIYIYIYIYTFYIYIYIHYIYIYIYILAYVENQHHDVGLSENDEYQSTMGNHENIITRVDAVVTGPFQTWHCRNTGEIHMIKTMEKTQ